MKVCVFGAGAVGGHLAARLSAANHAEVSVVARGAQLQAIAERGLLLKSRGQEIRGEPARATDDPTSLPPQDVVLVTMKAHVLPPLADAIARVAAPHGSVVFFLNGIPWWWRHGASGPRGPLPLLDPEGALWTKLRERTLGCVVYSPNDLEAPGVIVHSGGNRYVMGEPDGTASARLKAVVDLFCRSGLPAEVSPDVRREIWRKLMSNASTNPLAALTRLGISDIGADEELRAVSIALKNETLAVAAAIGWDLREEMDVEKHARRAVSPGAPRPSMLQDALQGKPLEVEAHLGQTQAFAREAGVPVPCIDVVLPILRGLDRSLRAASGKQ
ncbi:MAG: ketopantoate reductase family protein [Burkholderiales bacterium]